MELRTTAKVRAIIERAMAVSGLTAGQEQKRNIAEVFVARDDELGVVGYYSLSAFSIETRDLPDDLSHKLPRYDAIPAVLIGRLARDSRVKGQGVGELLIAAALRQIIDTSERMGIYAIVVEAKREKAAAFYREYGFQPLRHTQTMLATLACRP